MDSTPLLVIVAVLLALNAASSLYVLAAIRCVRAFARREAPTGEFQPPVTVLKPVCGLEAELHENLLSFCLQSYPEFQVIFGIRDPADPARGVVERLIREHPDLDLSLVVNERAPGANLKISNLSNMYPAAKHPVILIADSDMRVDSSYLANVVAPLEDASVGAVTCLYRARSRRDIPSSLASLQINESFLPSVLVSLMRRELDFCLGATMVVRRKALEAIGGFRALEDYLADDHMLGRLVSQQGFTVVLSGYLVDNVVHEKGFRSLIAHELRWARTIRTVAPWGHAFSFVMYILPVTMVTALLSELAFGSDLIEWVLNASALALRMRMHRTVGRALGTSDWRDTWLVPVRDVLGLGVWLVSLFGRHVNWKGRDFTVLSSGHISPPADMEQA